ncbi:hypothetical protein L6164_018371 [Bauhinia variegata]|uniref:Uncharacterized protein n=1 Tax=Bauhinia variegata TaxID=167791 RepID=A0ACB9NB09_BAUVA|nr:hypothetical protein L6164_018371 [Bauhinia variegata]
MIELFVLQAWNLYETGELEKLVDALLVGDFNVEEACRFCKVGLLCAQDSPKLRPSMSTVLDMLLGETDVNDQYMEKPGLLFDFDDDHDPGKQKMKAEVENTSFFGGSGKQDVSTSSETVTSYGAMTFTSIYDRTN